MAITKEVNIIITSKGSAAAIAQANKLSTSLKTLEKNNENLGHGFKGTGNAILENAGNSEILNNVTGGLSSTISETAGNYGVFSKAIVVGTAIQKGYTLVIGTTTGALKALKIALLTSGLGAIVVLISAVVVAMSNMESATEKAEKAQRRLNASFEASNKVYKDRIDLIDGVTKSDILRAKIAGKTEKEIRDIEKKGAEEKFKALKEEEKTLLALQAQKGKSVEEQTKINDALKKNTAEFNKLIADENNKALEYDLDIIEKKREKTAKLTEEQKKQAKKDREEKIAEDEAQRKKDLEDLKNALQAQKEAIQDSTIEISEAISNEQDKQNEFLGTAQEAEEQKIKDKYFRLLELAKQQGRSKEELWILEDARENELNDIRLAAQEKYYENYKIAKEKELALDLAVKEAKRNALDAGLNILMQFAGKNKSIAMGILAIQKGLAIADVVVGAAKSIGLAQANLAAVPAVIGVVPNPMYAVQAAATVKGIALTKITAATSIASILAASIGQAKSISGGGGDGGSSGGGGGSMSGAAPRFNVVGNSGVNQLAQTLGGTSEQAPIQAYVVASNVTSAQSMNRNIVTNASLG